MNLPEPLPWQRRFMREAFADGVRTAALSLARGNGKSALSARILYDCLRPGAKWNLPGAEYVLCAGSTEQARFVFRPLRAALEGEDAKAWSFTDSQRLLGIRHRATGTRLRVQSSNGRTAMGLVGTPLVVADEPGSWEVAGGQLMHEAIQGSQGKPGSSLRALYVGTLAPSRAGWWHDLVDGGSHGPVHVTALKGDPAKWDQWSEIRRCNPLMSRFAESRRVLLDERDAARRDSRLRAAFLSYRLNVPSADESEVLLTTDDWKAICSRPVGLPSGRPIVGIDLGGGRAWSAAVALWPTTGRLEAVAVAPGLPSIQDQERRDRVPKGSYERLVESGRLVVAHGRQVPPPELLMGAVQDAWGSPAKIVADRFRRAELADARPPCPLVSRVVRWSEAAFDIRSLRRQAKDGDLSCAPSSRLLVAASLAQAMVKNDDAGNCRLVKRGTNNAARDDVSAALVLVAGLRERQPTPRPLKVALVA